MDSFSSQDTDFLLASRRAFTPESSPIPTSRPVSLISLSFAENGAVVVDVELDDEELLSEIPETSPVARSKQVYIEWMEATLLSIYLPEVKRTLICTFDLPFCLRPPCCLRREVSGTQLRDAISARSNFGLGFSLTHIVAKASEPHR
jgi:hypothetical protein